MMARDRTRPPTRMTQLDEALQTFLDHDGVRNVLLVGTDGLLVRHLGIDAGPDIDRVAARVPVVFTAAEALSRAVGSGNASTAVLELGASVAIVSGVSAELLLAVLVGPGVGFAGLLRDIRRDRGRIAGLL